MKHLIILMAVWILPAILLAQDKWTSGRPDGHAPISIMGDHTHGKGDWMFSYRLMNMSMEGMQAGKTDVSTSDVLKNYMMTPISMRMLMHMLGVMYAPSGRLTLMAMAMYKVNIMSVVMKNTTTGMLMNSTMKSFGFGDARVMGMYKLLDQNSQRVHLNLGINIPTGSINVAGVSPMSAPNETQLPYTMQLGSGTFGIMPGFTYLGQNHNLSWGSQMTSMLRIGRNSHQYTRGDQASLTGWLAYRLQSWVSTSFRLTGNTSGRISGGDSLFVSQMQSPTVRTSNYGGSTVYNGLGLNFYIPSGAFKDLRIGVEYQLPVYQYLRGVQMKQKSITTIGVQYSL